jgi:hypothetical protein
MNLPSLFMGEPMNQDQLNALLCGGIIWFISTVLVAILINRIHFGRR